MRRSFVVVALCALLTGCLWIPEGATAVQNFKLERHLGTWYEIARLDHGFERGLSRVQARYSLREDGGVRVINSGFDAEKGEWSEAEGKAYFIGEADTGRLKASFFGPFYGAYNIVQLDEQDYSYALVAGPAARGFFLAGAGAPGGSAFVAQQFAHVRQHVIDETFLCIR